MKARIFFSILMVLIIMPKNAKSFNYKVINPTTTVLESEWFVIQNFLNQEDSKGVSNGDKYFYGQYNPESFDMNAFVSYTTKYNESDNVEYKQITDFNIQDIILVNNQKFSGELNLEGLSELKYVYASDHSLSAISISKCIQLLGVLAFNNKLESFTITTCPKLESLYLYNNNLTSINTDYPSNLKYVRCERNYMRSMDCLKFNTEILTYKVFEPQKMNMPSGNITLSDYDILPEYSFDKSQLISTAYNANTDEEVYYLALNANGSFMYAPSVKYWNYWFAGDMIYLRLIIPEYLDPETDLEGLAFDLETNVFVVPETEVSTGISVQFKYTNVYVREKIVFIKGSFNSVSIYALSGQLIKRCESKSSNISINLSVYNKGLYIVCIDGISYKVVI